MWKNLITEIKQMTGYSQGEIASRCGCGQSTISDLLAEKTKGPRYDLGQKIIQLHQSARVDVAKSK